MPLEVTPCKQSLPILNGGNPRHGMPGWLSLLYLLLASAGWRALASADEQLRLSLLVDGRVEAVRFGPVDSAVAVAEAFGERFKLKAHERNAVAAQIAHMQSLDPARRNAVDSQLQNAAMRRERLGSIHFPSPDGRKIEVEVDASQTEHPNRLLAEVCEQGRIELTACDALGPRFRAAVQRLDTGAAAATAAATAATGAAAPTAGVAALTAAYERALVAERAALRASHARERSLAAAVRHAHVAGRAAQAQHVRDTLALGGRVCWRDDATGFRVGAGTCAGAVRRFAPDGAVLVGAGRRLHARRYAACELSLEHYLEHASRFEPFVITAPAAGPHSPGMPSWDLSLLRLLCGGRSVLLQHSTPNSTAWGGLETLRWVRLREFVAALLNEPGADPQLTTGYLHDTKLASLCPELLVPGASLGRAASGVSIPALFGADYLQRISGLADGLRNGWPSLFVGPRGSSTSLHSDHGDTASWMGLLAGRKRWVIVPPWDVPLLGQNFSAGTVGVRFGADLIALADAATAEAAGRAPPPSGAVAATRPSFYDIDMRAGDVLFVPAACPHQVQNLALSVSVAQNFVDAAGVHRFADRMQEMSESAGHTGLVARYFASVAKGAGSLPGLAAARRVAAAVRRAAQPDEAEFGARAVSYADFKAGHGADWLLGALPEDESTLLVLHEEEEEEALENITNADDIRISLATSAS